MTTKTLKATSPDHLTPGSLWTISPNKARRDNSWSGDVWEVIRVSGPTVFLRLRGPRLRDYGNVIDVQYTEHDWFAADDLLDELRRHTAEAAEEWRSFVKMRSEE